MSKAQGKISAVFEFNQFGLLKKILLSAENEEDQAILIKGISQVLKPNRNFLKKIFSRYDG